MCEVEDGWWKGRLGGRVSLNISGKVSFFFVFWQISSFLFAKCNDYTVFQVGVFPSNFVEMCEDDSADQIKSRAETIEELPLSSKV